MTLLNAEEKNSVKIHKQHNKACFVKGTRNNIWLLKEKNIFRIKNERNI